MTPNHETDTLEGLVARWRKLAADSRDEAGRIRRTVFVATDAEANCFVRAEVWDGVADELDKWLGQPATADQNGCGEGRIAMDAQGKDQAAKI